LPEEEAAAADMAAAAAAVDMVAAAAAADMAAAADTVLVAADTAAAVSDTAAGAAAEAAAAEVAAAAGEAAAAAAGAVAVCRGEVATSARLEPFPFTLADAGRHGPGLTGFDPANGVCSAAQAMRALGVHIAAEGAAKLIENR
jgi:hypothetical protein